MNRILQFFHRVCECGHPMSAMTPAALDQAHDDHDEALHREPVPTRTDH